MINDLMVIENTLGGIMARNKEKYKRNRERVYDLYGVDEKLRGKSWNCHHQQYRSEGGGDNEGNLFPAPVKLHNRIHQGDSGKELHAFCEQEYGGDPYQGAGTWDTQEWGGQSSQRKKRKPKRKGRRKKNKRRR